MAPGSEQGVKSGASSSRDEAPAYIPSLSQNMLMCRPTTIPGPSAKLWGKERAKPLKSADNHALLAAPINSTGDNTLPSYLDAGRTKTSSDFVVESDFDDDSHYEYFDEDKLPKTNNAGIIDFQKLSQLFVSSKRADRRAKRKAKLPRLRRTSEEIDKYDLNAVYEKIREQKRMLLTLLQQPYQQNRPRSLWDKSIKAHLKEKVDVLTKIKSNTLICGNNNGDSHDKCDIAGPMNRRVRRQRKLRESIGLSNEVLTLTAKFNVPITAADLERELAIAMSRDRIEDQMNLPDDRLKRLATLRMNVENVNNTFFAFARRGSARGSNPGRQSTDEKVLYYEPSRFVKAGMALTMFKKYAKIVLIVSQWIRMMTNNRYNFERQLRSFVDIAHDVDESTRSMNVTESGLSFDKKYYKANREISLSQEARKILTTRWQCRTPEMVKQVMTCLQSLRSLSEYPVRTQQQLCKVAWYQTIRAKKVIVRQGHHAKSFYFILSGTAFVKKLTADPVTGDSVSTAAILTRGHSFGEIGLLFNTRRTATVESATAMELLVISKEDFVRIFMKTEDPNVEPEHLTFLRQLTFLKYWPIEVLKSESGACLIHYFKRDSLVTDSDKHSEWIYIIMSVGNVRRDQTAWAAQGDPDARVDVGKRRIKTSPVHPEIFNKMTDFYDNLRQMLPTKEGLIDKYRLTSQSKTSESGSDNASRPAETDVFVKLERLQASDSFGLNTLKYAMEADDDICELGGKEATPILSLVSCGAEVIMISKKIFLKYADNRCKLAVKDAIREYPAEDTLQENMQTAVDWEFYRGQVMSQYVEQMSRKTKTPSAVSALF